MTHDDTDLNLPQKVTHEFRDPNSVKENYSEYKDLNHAKEINARIQGYDYRTQKIRLVRYSISYKT